MKKFILIVILFTSSFAAYLAQPAIQWQKSLGGSANDFAQSVEVTLDGGYVAIGTAASNNNDVTGNHGQDDVWLVKLGGGGNLKWQKCFGGSNYDNGHSIQQTSDGGYIVAGGTNSNDGDVTGLHGSGDVLVLKLDSLGTIQWQKCFGGSLLDDAFSVQQTSDGGYIIGGDTQSSDGDVSGNHGSYDSWIIKLDGSGNLQWQKCLGGSGDESASEIQQTHDGGYIISGSTLSNNGDVSGNNGGWDYWIVKLNSSGSLQWQKCLGGTAQDIGYSIRETLDSNFILAGFTFSKNGDVTGLHGTGSQPDQWIVKLSWTGNVLWQKCLGGTGDDKAYNIRQTNDGGYVVAGYTKSSDGDVSGIHVAGIHDYWLVKLDPSGAVSWQKCLGGSNTDWARSVRQTADGGYVIAGWAQSTNGDVSGNHGLTDFWVVKLGSTITGLVRYGSPAARVFPNPATGHIEFRDIDLNKSTIRIYNAFGGLVLTGEAAGEICTISLLGFSSGCYFYNICKSDNTVYSGKFIKE